MNADPDLTRLCPGCFADKGAANPCPHCGFDEQAPRPAQALALRTLLNGQFVIGRVLGKPGGFGITYLGWDRQLQTRVAIKEYLPRDLAVRAPDGSSILPHTAEEDGLFRYGLEQFLAEARTLARMDHPNIVRVRHFFEANRSAYLVMDYYRGLSLAEHLERLEQRGGPGRLSERNALTLMQPILDGLRAVHAKGFLHRDVKPQNIYLAQTDSGGVRPVLLDFGAARQAVGERSRSLSVVISPGYAPFEQYHRKGTQGPPTDIYGAAAVLYRMLTGETPPEATERMADDTLRPPATFGVSQAVSDAIVQGLAMSRAARPQTVQAFQRLLMAGMGAARGPTPSGPGLAPASGIQDQHPSGQPKDPNGAKGPRPAHKVVSGLRPVQPSPKEDPWLRPAQPSRKGDDWRWVGGIALLLIVLIGFWLQPEPTPDAPAPGDVTRDTSGVGDGVGTQPEPRREVPASHRGVSPDPAVAAVGPTVHTPDDSERSAYSAATSVDTVDAYQAYLARCPPQRCAYGAEAQLKLGEMYEQGRGVAQDDRKAVQWWRKAAEQGDAVAQFRLGEMYVQGRGVPRDDRQAVEWFRKAAEQGDAGGQDRLGTHYRLGRGVERDYRKAVQWYRKAAEQGYVEAQFNLGVMYAEGRGVARDDRKALQLWRELAEKGLSVAQHNLGVMYRDGRGVPKDDGQAAQWFEQAAGQGYSEAQDALDELRRTGR